MPNTREKLIELVDDYTDSLSVRDLHKADFAEKFADHLIANGVTVQKWIPVTERLPEDYKERVLVKIKDANNIIGHPDMDTDRHMGDIWVRWGHKVTHWMPLPEPPKGE